MRAGSAASLVACAALASALLSTLGCKETGSCKSGQLDDGSRICVSYHDGDLAQSFKGVCATLMKGTWSKAPCDGAGALGACQMKNGKSDMWMFPSDKHKTAADVQSFCEEEGDVFLPPPAGK